MALLNQKQRYYLLCCYFKMSWDKYNSVNTILRPNYMTGEILFVGEKL